MSNYEGSTWDESDQRRAQSNGWLVAFHNDKRVYEIQKYEEYVGEYPCQDDDHAERYVTERAKRGFKLELKALNFIKNRNDGVNNPFIKRLTLSSFSYTPSAQTKRIRELEGELLTYANIIACISGYSYPAADAVQSIMPTHSKVVTELRRNKLPPRPDPSSTSVKI